MKTSSLAGAHARKCWGLNSTRQPRLSPCPPKTEKALNRVSRLATMETVSRHDLECLLVSLRRVCWCLRVAKPQHVQSACKASPRRWRILEQSELQLDLDWFRRILQNGKWTGLPTAMFCADPVIDIHLYMDASDHGLAVLDPANRRFIQVRFDEPE